MNIGLERGNLIVVPRPSRPTLSQEEKEREREGGREGEREGEKEGGRSSREEHSSEASLGVNAKEISRRTELSNITNFVGTEARWRRRRRSSPAVAAARQGAPRGHVLLKSWHSSMGLAEQSLRRDAFCDATLSQQASSLGVVGDWAAARALLASAILLRCM
jgi:hypothetical protein